MKMDGMLRRVGSFVVLMLVLGLALQPVTALAQGNGPNSIPVSGFSFPVVELGEEFFPDAGPNQIGIRGAIGYISPFLEDPFDATSAILTNGFVGDTIIQERVVRVLASNADPHRFTFNSEQIISSGIALTPPGLGGVIVDGELIAGTFTQKLRGTGTLQDTCGPDPDPQDIGDDQTNCAAATFSGTWNIKGNSGTGDLTELRGHGTFEWLGCVDYANPLTCSLPTYEGIIHFAGGGQKTGQATPPVVRTSGGDIVILDAEPVYLPALLRP